MCAITANDQRAGLDLGAAVVAADAIEYQRTAAGLDQRTADAGDQSQEHQQSAFAQHHGAAGLAGLLLGAMKYPLIVPAVLLLSVLLLKDDPAPRS